MIFRIHLLNGQVGLTFDVAIDQPDLDIPNPILAWQTIRDTGYCVARNVLNGQNYVVTAQSIALVFVPPVERDGEGNPI